VSGSGSAYLTLTLPTGLAAGNYPFSITATSGTLSHTVGPLLAVAASNYTGQAGWLATPVGGTGTNDSASFSAGVLTATAGGANISSTSDNFYFVYQAAPLIGSGTFFAELVTDTGATSGTNFAVMLRSGFLPWDTDVFLTFSGSLLDLSSRSVEGGTTSTPTSQSSPTLPRWLELVWSGSTVTAYISSNGTSWTQVGSPVTFTAAQLYAGVAMNGTSTVTVSPTFNNLGN
jgi:hypothetical protein